MLKRNTGFTIVELLIVIVVIAVLAAISIVAYNGIQNRANDSAVQSDLRNFVNQATAKLTLGDITQYPGGNDTSLNSVRFAFNQSSYSGPGGLLYCVTPDRDLMVIFGTSKSSTLFFRTSDGRTGTRAQAAFGALCSEFTGSTQSSNARYGGSGTTWYSWTQAG